MPQVAALELLEFTESTSTALQPGYREEAGIHHEEDE